MPRSIFAGGSNYGDVPFDELSKDLEKWAGWMDDTVHQLDEAFAQLRDEGLVDAMDPNYIANAKNARFFFSTAAGEFRDIAADIRVNVAEHHLRRLDAINATGREYDTKMLEAWRDEQSDRYGIQALRPVLRERRDLWEAPYRLVREATVDLADVSNLRNRLADFVGRSGPRAEPRGDSPPWRSGFFYLAALVVIAVLVVGLVLFFVSLRVNVGAALASAAGILLLSASTLVIVGALQLKADNRISDATLKELITAGLQQLGNAFSPSSRTDSVAAQPKSEDDSGPDQ